MLWMTSRPTAENRKRVGDPVIGERRDADRCNRWVNDIDIIVKGDPVKLGRHGAEEVPVGHPAISAHFPNVMDLNSGVRVILRI